MTIFGIHAYITLMNWRQFWVTLCYSYYMRNRIRHNYPSLIQCLRAFHILIFAQLLYCCHCYNYYKTATVTFATVTVTSILLATKYFAADIKSFKFFIVINKYKSQVTQRIELCSPATTPEISLDNPQVQGITTTFEGRVFNPNLLIRHKGSQRIFLSISS